MTKSRLNISLDKDLVDFVKVFAAENRLIVAEIVTQYLLTLKRRVEGKDMERILALPAFQEAMKEIQIKFVNGTATWHSYDEVFR